MFPDDDITPHDTDPVNGAFPPLLGPDAALEDVVKAVNGLAVEMQFARCAVQELGTRIETFLVRIEKAVKIRVRP